MKFKNIIALSALALALSACGGDDEDKKDNDNKDDKNPVVDIQKAIAEANTVKLDLKDAPADAKDANGNVDLRKLAKKNEVKAYASGENTIKVATDGETSSVTFDVAKQDVEEHGYDTPEAALKDLKATYKGQAFTTGDEIGVLTYNVDFTTKKHNGEITGITAIGESTGIQKIVLGDATAEKNELKGDVTFLKETPKKEGETAEEPQPKDGANKADNKGMKYELEILGDKAQAIAGSIKNGDKDVVGMFGTK